MALHNRFRDAGLEYLAGIARRNNVTMAAKLKAFVTTLDDVTDEHKDLYVADKDADGKDRFKLDAEGLEDVTGLKRTLTATRTELRTAKARVKPLEGLEEDEDVDAIITAGRQAIEAQRTGAPIPAVESVKTQMTAAHNKEVKKLNARIEGMNSALRDALIESAAVSAITDPEMKGNKTLLLPHIKTVTDIVEIEDGEKIRYEARVFDKPATATDRQERVDPQGKPLTVKALVAELRENSEYSGAFEGSGASGSGATTEGGGGMPAPPGRVPTRQTPAAAAKDAKRATIDYSL